MNAIKHLLANLKMDIDNESVTIYIYREKEEHIPVVYWHIKEVEEDATVALSIANAINLFHTNPSELLSAVNAPEVSKLLNTENYSLYCESKKEIDEIPLTYKDWLVLETDYLDDDSYTQ